MKKSEKTKEFQVKLFDNFKKSVQTNFVLADEIADLLHISKDAAYRRIRGETLIDIEELMSLCDHFRRSLDAVIGNIGLNQIRCLYTPLDMKEEKNLMAYTDNLAYSLKRIKESSENEILLSASCIPIFCMDDFKDLVLFNFF